MCIALSICQRQLLILDNLLINKRKSNTTGRDLYFANINSSRTITPQVPKQEHVHSLIKSHLILNLAARKMPTSLTRLLLQGLGAHSAAAHLKFNRNNLHNIPPGAPAHISIIDSTLRINALPPKDLVLPKIPEFDVFPPVPAWSFLIESSTGQRALFDLGVPPNYNESLSPPLLEAVAAFGWDISVQKHVVDILKEHGVAPESIKAIIWSHSHWDHIGDPSTFPNSTDLVVGPGFKKAMLPAYPTNPASFLREEYFM